jgi:regulatory protein
MVMSKKVYTQTQALEKMRKYCVYQERCQAEIIQKLREIGIYGDEAENVLIQLIDEGFVDELRFAQAYAGGKFRLKKWGKRLIIQKLKEKQISAYCIQEALKEIDDQEYIQSLNDLIDKKMRLSSEKNSAKLKASLIRYLYSKGYESELIYEELGKRL